MKNNKRTFLGWNRYPSDMQFKMIGQFLKDLFIKGKVALHAPFKKVLSFLRFDNKTSIKGKIMGMQGISKAAKALKYFSVKPTLWAISEDQNNIDSLDPYIFFDFYDYKIKNTHDQMSTWEAGRGGTGR